MEIEDYDGLSTSKIAPMSSVKTKGVSSNNNTSGSINRPLIIENGVAEPDF